MTRLDFSSTTLGTRGPPIALWTRTAILGR